MVIIKPDKYASSKFRLTLSISEASNYEKITDEYGDDRKHKANHDRVQDENWNN